MKNVFLYFLVFFPAIGISQPDTSKRLSTVTLDTVIIAQKEQHIARVRLKGFPSYNGLTQTKAVVSYVGDLPGGILKSVSFYFNCGLVNHLKKSLNINYKDVELGLLVYKVNSDTTLGEAISENDIHFSVLSSHRGPFKVDISQLNIQEKSIFIGFSVISKLPADENNIYVRYNESKSGISYVKMNVPFMSQDWRRGFSTATTELKLNVEILQ